MDKAQALHKFWSSFGLPAYDANTVPSTVDYPRLTYEASFSDFDSTVVLSASIWYRAMGWADITAKSDEIGAFIGYGGTVVPCDNGAIWIMKETPFAQRMADPDPDIRRIVLMVSVNFLTID